LKSVHFEYLGEDIEVPGAIKWHVEAIHVTTTKNGRKFTSTELAEAGRSLSFRPLDINHEEDRVLPFPENKTLHMKYNPEKMLVEGNISVSDQLTNEMITSKRIEAVSIEQIPTSESCNDILCEQHGVAFIGLGLLERGIVPGDGSARITGQAESLTHYTDSTGNHKYPKLEPIANLIVSDEQRLCKECSDMVPCHSCYHKKEIDKSMQLCLDRVQSESPGMPQDQRVMHCLEILNRIDKPGFKSLTIQLNEQNDCVSSAIQEIKSAHPDWERDRVIATALSKCGQSKPEYANYFYKIAKENYGKNI